MNKKEYSWISVAYPPGQAEVTLLQCDTWYAEKSEAINNLKSVIKTRGIDIPDRWGSAVHFVTVRKRIQL